MTIPDISIYAAGTHTPPSTGTTASTTVVTTSGSPSGIGNSVTFTATVTPAGATGSVDFYEGDTYLGTGVLSSGVAIYSTAALALGTHTIQAEYSGDATYMVSYGTVSQVVTSVPAPTITTIAPTTGPIAGGTTVVITGTNLTGGTVTFGSLAATCTVNSATQITCTTPAHAAGPVDVVVTTPGGPATSKDGFTYVSAPTLTSIAPNSGPVAGGTTVVITGANLTGGTVTFGGLAATCTVNSATQITCATPAHPAGPVDVVVTTPGGTATFTGGFTYIPAPTITTLFPNSGPVEGGTEVVIVGTNFLPGTKVYFGGAEATCTLDSETKMTCITPAHVKGFVDVVIVAPGGTVTLANGFEYLEVKVAIFYSDGKLDGWIRESGLGTKKGGVFNSKLNIPVGDDRWNQQVRSILSFNTKDTKKLPAKAVITAVRLRIHQLVIIGTDPFTIFGKLNVDIRKGSFGLPALESSDFQARASKARVGAVNSTISGSGWYLAELNSKAITNINKAGLTQLRLYFTTPTNKNKTADYFRYEPGDTRAVNKPELIVYYTLP